MQRARPLLGTFVSIRVDDANENAEAAIDAAFAHISDIQKCMSFHESDSELMRINTFANQEPQKISSHFKRVLQASLSLSKASGGYFDPTIAGQLVAWGMLPAPNNTIVDPTACWRDVVFLPDGRLYFKKPLWLDLGGIAKGYAVDLATNCLRRNGVLSGLVNAGGDLRAFGKKVTVHVRNPGNPQQSSPLLEASNIAVATSAGYFSEVNGNTALLDPHNNKSLGHSCSVTVCAPRAIWADALTKVVLANPNGAHKLLQRLHATSLIIDNDGTRRELH